MKKRSKIVLSACFAVLFVAIALLCLYISSTGAVTDTRGEKADTYWNDGWTFATVTISPTSVAAYEPSSPEPAAPTFTLDGTIPRDAVSDDGTLHINKRLPTTLPDDAYFMLASNYLPVTATIDGIPIQVAGSFFDGVFGLTYASPQSTIALPADAAGKVLELALYPYGCKTRMEVYAAALGSEAAVVNQLAAEGMPVNALCLLLVVTVILLLCFTFVIHRSYGAPTMSLLIWTGLFILLATVWFFTDTRINGVLLGSSPAYLFINLLPFLLQSIPFMFIAMEACTGGQRIFKAVIGLQLGIVAIVTTLLFFGIFSLAWSLSITHLLLGIAIISIWAVSAFDYFKHDIKSELWILIGMTVIGASSLAAMLQFYLTSQPDNAFFFRWGFVFYVVLIIALAVIKVIGFVTESKSIRQLAYAADHDSLTEIYNPRGFDRATRELLKNNPETDYAVGCFDINRFKLINDLFGRERGDELLRFIAKQTAQYMDGRGTYARRGSDTFLVCLPDTLDDIDGLVSVIHTSLQDYEIAFDIMTTFGFYHVEDADMPVAAMTDRAAMAANTIKGNVVARVSYYDDTLRRELLEEQLIANDMTTALAEEQLFIELQPKCQLATHEIVGAEVLVRWQHPLRGRMSPGLFIPIFEKNGFIMKLDHFVWEKACMVLRSWLDQGHALPLSVNISRVNLHNPELVSTLVGLVNTYDIPPQLLELEITESAYSDNPQLLNNTVAELRAAGFFIEMDDFGSGYSSLNALKDIYFDLLKIDMKFLYGHDDTGRSNGILTAVVRMAESLGLPTIAEGIETAEQAELLRDIGCTCGQGYYFYKPMSVAEFEKLF